MNGTDKRLVLASVIVLVSFCKSMTQLSDTTELCSEEKPIDGGINSRDDIYFFKGSHFWKKSTDLNNQIEGPFYIKDLFEKLRVDSIDAAFHINRENKVNSDDSRGSQYFDSLAFIFKDQYYYIYYKYNNYIEVIPGWNIAPYKLPSPNGTISQFNIKDQSITAALFDRTKTNALLIADTDVYEVPFKEFSTDKPKVRRVDMKTTLGINERVDAAIDLQNEVMLIFGQKYCMINMSEPKCIKQSIQDFLKCNTQVITTTIDTEITNQNTDSERTPKDKTDTIPTPKDESKEGDRHPLLIILIIIFVLLAVVLILCVVWFCVLSNKKSVSSNISKNDINSQNRSMTEKTD